MTIWMEEAFKSREGTAGISSSFDLIYFTGGESDELTAEAYVITNAPSDYRGYPLRTCAHELIAYPDVFKWTLNYGADAGSPPTDNAGEPPLLSFTAGGGTAHVTNGITTPTAYEDATVYPSGAPDFKGAIGIQIQDKETVQVNGVDIIAPLMEYSYSRRFAATDITTAYVDAIFSVCGKVNNGTFYGRPAGSVLFKGCRGTSAGPEFWDLAFDFAYSPNLTGLTIGAITGIAKKGWQYLDVIYEDVGRNVDSGIRLKKPTVAFVHTVYYPADFAALGIGTF